MFTGIVEEMGVVQLLVKGLQGAGLTVLAKSVMEGLDVGESISLSGACMTVVDSGGDRFRVDLSPETLKVTTLGFLKAGDPVNLERAMQLIRHVSHLNHLRHVIHIRSCAPHVNRFARAE